MRRAWLLLVGAAACSSSSPKTNAADAGAVDPSQTDEAGGGDAGDEASGPSGGRGDFELDLVGFGAHEARNVYLKVKTPGGIAQGPVAQAAIKGGTATLIVPATLIDNVEYRADFYVDVNSNGQCDAPPVDHAYRFTFTGRGTGVTQSFTHDDSNMTNVCSPRF